MSIKAQGQMKTIRDLSKIGQSSANECKVLNSHTTVGGGILRHSRQKPLQILSLFTSKFTKEKLLQFVPSLT